MTLFDTNIFIDLLNGCPQAGIELTSYPEPAISVITLMELRAGVAGSALIQLTGKRLFFAVRSDR